MSDSEMDRVYDVERDVLGMRREELLSTIYETISSLLSEAAEVLNLPPPPFPAGLEVYSRPQPADSQGGGAAACVCEQPSQLTEVSALCRGFVEGETMQQSQGQVTLSEGQSLCCVGTVNGERLWPVVDAPTFNTSHSKKRKRDNHQDDERPYVKKPPNAFMLFMREQRPKIAAEIDHGGKGNAAVNTVLGQRWKSLTREQQAKYYMQADQERALHAQQHPQWSSKQNYGKKRKRRRGPAPTRAEASVSEPEEVTQQAKKLCVTQLQTPLVEPSSSSQLPLTHRGAASTSQASPDAPASTSQASPDAPASTSQASPDAPAQTETESILSQDNQGQYETVTEEFEALLQSLGEEFQLPPHSDLCTMDFDLQILC